jgi:hypothetical protein
VCSQPPRRTCADSSGLPRSGARPDRCRRGLGPVLVWTDAAAAWPHGPVPGVAVWLGSDPPAGPDEPSGRWGIVAGPDFWDGATPPAEAALVLAPVPADAEPEAVMKQVRALA